MVCYQENDNNERREIIVPQQEEEKEEDDYDDLPELEWGDNPYVNPAEEEEEQEENDRIERMNYLMEQQTEEFYRRFGEESDFFPDFQLPAYISNSAQQRPEEE